MANESKPAPNPRELEQEILGVEDELHEVEEELQRFEIKQSRSTRLLQIMVYPSLAAFILLAGYGFYLIQSLTTDVHRLTNIIADMEHSVSSNMTSMSGNMQAMSQQIQGMSNDTKIMSSQMAGMVLSAQQMSNDLQEMNATTHNMAVSTYHMQGDMRYMSRNVSKPFKFMNRFIPFSGSNKQQYMAPPMMAPYYPQNGYYSGWMYNSPQPNSKENTEYSQPADQASPQSNNHEPVEVQLTRAQG